MIAKSDVENILAKYFGETTDRDTIQRVSDEIAGLTQEWELLDLSADLMGFTLSVTCTDICYLAEHIERGEEIRLFRRRKTPEKIIA
ncbi:MAG: hypothetical protein HYR55_01050 [Acidobacteria bacterium]|nr:hypothetical protein [Acidobacteriota bacterium]MBI3655607.1 hypothetical protein [Acidobacteriota bacterium]